MEKAQAEARTILDEARDTAEQTFRELNEMRRRQRKEEDWQRVNDERAALFHQLNQAEGKLGRRPEAPVPPPTRPARENSPPLTSLALNMMSPPAKPQASASISSVSLAQSTPQPSSLRMRRTAGVGSALTGKYSRKSSLSPNASLSARARWRMPRSL